MIKPSSVFFLILFIIAMLAGCTNPLWYGGGTDRGLTLELELPELPGTDRISRALAFQGKHLYVEIAEILDESVYFDPNQDRNTDDSAFFNLDTGDGVWTATPWGAHAVVHRDYTNTSSTTINFNGIPKDRNLLLRVVQGTSIDDMRLEMYGEIYPLVQSYNADGVGPWSTLGITLTPAMLANGTVRVPLRPHPSTMAWPPLNIYSGGAYSNLLGDGFIDFRPDNVGPGLPGQSEFSDIVLDMADDPTMDPGMFVGIHVARPDTSPIPGRLDIYKRDGSRIELSGGRDENSGGYIDSYRYYVIKADLNAQFGFNDDYFMGITIFDNIDVGANTNFYSTFDLIATPLTYVYVDSNGSFGNGTVNSHHISWGVPYPSEFFRPGDLEFQVLHYWYNPNTPPTGNTSDYDYVMSLGPMVALNWTTATSYFIDNGGDGDFYEIPDVLALPGKSINGVEGDLFFTVVAARAPGGEPFIIGVSSTSMYTAG